MFSIETAETNFIAKKQKRRIFKNESKKCINRVFKKYFALRTDSNIYIDNFIDFEKSNRKNIDILHFTLNFEP